MQICHIWDFMGLANEPNWSDWMSSALFQPFSNPFHKNYGPEVYLAYFYHIWAYLGLSLSLLKPMGQFFTIFT